MIELFIKAITLALLILAMVGVIVLFGTLKIIWSLLIVFIMACLYSALKLDEFVKTL